MNDYVTFLIAKLKRNGFSNNDISQSLNIAPSTLSRWLQGKTKPKLKHVYNLEHLLGQSNKKTEALIVEDDPTSRKVLSELLGLMGIDVASAGSAEQSYYMCENYEFGFVVMDIILPDDSGIEAAKVIKKMRSNTKIIACTGRLAEQDIEENIFDGVIMKPLVIKSLETVLIKENIAFRPLLFNLENNQFTL